MKIYWNKMKGRISLKIKSSMPSPFQTMFRIRTEVRGAILVEFIMVWDLCLGTKDLKQVIKETKIIQMFFHSKLKCKKGIKWSISEISCLILDQALQKGNLWWARQHRRICNKTIKVMLLQTTFWLIHQFKSTNK